MSLNNLKRQDRGNISFLTLAVIAVFAILFMFIFDFCRIFIAREVTKNASDAASLAVAQDLLFFKIFDCNRSAEKTAALNNCVLVECRCEYDEVVVTVEKEFDLVLLDRLIPGCSKVRSISKTEVIYPWEEQSGCCRSYEFGY